MSRFVDNLTPSPDARPWWHDAVFYEVDVPAFADSDSDGVGDLDGVRSRVGYLELLGVDALWLTRVPMTGAGPTVTSPDEAAAILEAFELLAAEAHDCGLRVVIDVGADLTGLGRPREREELPDTLRFWIDRGADGFRIASTAQHGAAHADPRAGDAVREADRMVRAVLDEYPERIVGALASDRHGSGWHLSFDQRLADSGFTAGELREAISRGASLAESSDTRPAWKLSGDGRPRQVTRYGGGETGHAGARAMALVALALPGVVCLDGGEELGLPDVAPRESSPTAARPGRRPMPWEGSGPAFGFTDAARTAPPAPPSWQHLTVEVQLEDAASTLSLYRQALDIRRTHHVFHGAALEWYGAPEGCLAFRRDGEGLTCALNTSEHPVPLPPGEILLSSAETTGDHLPANTAVWLV